MYGGNSNSSHHRCRTRRIRTCQHAYRQFSTLCALTWPSSSLSTWPDLSKSACCPSTRHGHLIQVGTCIKSRASLRPGATRVGKHGAGADHGVIARRQTLKSSSMSIPRISYLKRRGIVGGRRPAPEGHLRPAIICHHRAGWGRHGFFGLGLPRRSCQDEACPPPPESLLPESLARSVSGSLLPAAPSRLLRASPWPVRATVNGEGLRT